MINSTPVAILAADNPDISYVQETARQKRQKLFKSLYAEYANLRAKYRTRKIDSSIEGSIRTLLAHLTLDGDPSPARLANFHLMLLQLQRMGLTQVMPIRDVTTYKTWLKRGYKVRRGEKAALYSVSFKVYEQVKNEETGEVEKVPSKDPKPVIIPVFHIGQVDKIAP